MYDKNNVFAKIIRNEIPCASIVENDYAISFLDANPMFETHVLVIPKGEYENILDFTQNASAVEQLAFWECFTKTAAALGIDGRFNIMANTGADAPFIGQGVFHFHLHLVAGKRSPAFYEVLESLKCK